MPNVNKNNKIIRINLKSKKNQVNHSINTSKKDQNLPNKSVYINNSSGNPLPSTQITQKTNHHITRVIEVDRPNKEIHVTSHKIDIADRIAKIIKITIHDRIQTQQNLFLHPVPIQTQGIDTIPMIDHETHHTIEIENIHTIGIEVFQTIEIRTIQTIDQGITHIIDQIFRDQIITIKTDHEIIHKIETQVTIIDTEIIPSHHIGKITVIPILNIDIEVTHQNIKDTLIKYKQMKKQLQTPQVLMTQELQLNHINCESSDTESDTLYTISVNMITVEKDYEPIIYEQPFISHIYENELELLHNNYIGPINNNTLTTQVNEINTVIKSNKKDETQCSNTKHIYQNIQKEQPREKIWTIPFLLESPRRKEFQPSDLEIDFLIDSGAESNIINIPTWNEIKTLHPNLTLLQTSSKMATAQGSTIVNYGKIQLFLLPTRTMEQSKILNKPFKQTFHITDIRHKIIGLPFITNYIPTINILNGKIHIKDKYTKTKKHSLNILPKIKQKTTIFLKIFPHL